MKVILESEISPGMCSLGTRPVPAGGAAGGAAPAAPAGSASTAGAAGAAAGAAGAAAATPLVGAAKLLARRKPVAMVCVALFLADLQCF